MTNWLDDLRADLQYTWRTMAANKAFACAAILTLSLGIGANAAIFSVTDALLMRFLPVRHARDL